MNSSRCAGGLLLGLGACAAPDAPGVGALPNVVLVLADDVGAEAFGCYGGASYATPRLDALAEGGMRFDHAYSQPLCTPSRVKLMTGLGNLRNYVHFSILRPGERTFAHVARDAGYATCVVGKWQLYGAEHYGDWAGRGTHPRDAGFDTWCLWQLETLGSRYWDPRLDVDGELRTYSGRFGPDVFTDSLLTFAEEVGERPFFAYYPMALVHSPFVRTPEAPNGKRSKQEHFAEMMAYMDTLVGRIEDGLERLGKRKNTLFLFVGDNGTDRAVTSVANGLEIHGAKARSTTAGIHVPMIASWPGKVAPGGVCSDLVDLSDFLPTLAEVMGDHPGDDLDGRSFLPQLLGRRVRPREVLTMYSNPRPPGNERNPRVRFAFDKRYKLYDDGRLYDTRSDPLEEEPLSSGPAVVRARLELALESMPPEPEHLTEKNAP